MMQQYIKLKVFIESLGKELEPIDLVTRKEILENLEKQIIKLSHTNTLPLEKILKELGSPKKLANRYLVEQGIPPKKTGLGGFAWLLIILGSGFLTMLLAVLLLAWSFSPLLKINEQNGELVILGGLIDIKESQGKFKMGNIKIEHKNYKFSGNFPYEEGKHHKFQFQFANGNIDIKTEVTKDILWECESNQKMGGEIEVEEDTISFLPAGNASGLNCKLTLPEQLSLNIEGTNGKIKVSPLHAAAQIKLNNGLVELLLDSHKKYNFDASLQNGQLPSLPQDQSADSIPVKIEMINGKVVI